MQGAGQPGPISKYLKLNKFFGFISIFATPNSALLGNIKPSIEEICAAPRACGADTAVPKKKGRAMLTRPRVPALCGDGLGRHHREMTRVVGCLWRCHQRRFGFLDIVADPGVELGPGVAKRQKQLHQIMRDLRIVAQVQDR